jgi:hypothetical protein
LNLIGLRFHAGHQDNVAIVVYLAIASALMTVPDVRIDQGRLTLNGIVAGTAAMLLNPLDATIASRSMGLDRKPPHL